MYTGTVDTAALGALLTRGEFLANEETALETALETAALGELECGAEDA